jgi:AcrR family transcriptional regulator
VLTPPSDPLIEQPLLDAAHRAIEHHGWHDATLERVAAEAGVSRMTLHRQRVSRAGLLAALADRLERQHRDALAPALVAPGTARQRLELALAAECALTEDNLALLEALGGAARDAIYHEREAPALTRAAFVDPYRRLLRDGLEDGTLVVADPDEAAIVLINLVGHTYRHLRRGHGWEPERARAGICAMALDGVATR